MKKIILPKSEKSIDIWMRMQYYTIKLIKTQKEKIKIDKIANLKTKKEIKAPGRAVTSQYVQIHHK